MTTYRSDSATDKNAPKFVNDHRKTCFWESIYDPEIDLSLYKEINIREVDNIRHNGDHLKNYVINLDDFSNYSQEKPNTKRITIKNATFENCDLRGNNKGQKITFAGCVFKKVYFGHAELHDINFESCDFDESSFSLAKFINCSFNDHCKFKRVSISGGKTNFENSIINSGNLLLHSFKYATNEYCNEHGFHKEEQVYRMYLSQVKLARNILNSVSVIGDDDTYYNATKTLFQLRLKERESKINLSARNYKDKAKDEKKIKNWSFYLYKKLRSSLFPVEKFMLNIFGFINGWGSNFLRCIAFGFLICISFSLVYLLQGIDSIALLSWSAVGKSIIQSLDITFLAGYTKYSTTGTPPFEQFILLINMILGLFWYGVSLPTLINKISVARL